MKLSATQIEAAARTVMDRCREIRPPVPVWCLVLTAFAVTAAGIFLFERPESLGRLLSALREW